MTSEFRKVLDIVLPEHIAPEYLDGETTVKEFFKQILLHIWDTDDDSISEILNISNPYWKTDLKKQVIMSGIPSCDLGYAHAYVSDLILEIFSEREY
jgi:hypothetical protein